MNTAPPPGGGQHRVQHGAQGGAKASGPRLFAVDALRGLAAMAVVLFHYTTRYVELYGGAGSPSMSFPQGHYGVNLFFIISGFVIFMTLEKTRRPMDFVVSRFSRLFPAYWVAVALTFAITSTFGLAGKEVSALQALGNLMMVHAFFHIPHVDGVYWTLEVEMLFYAGMLLVYSTGRLKQIHTFLLALLALRLAYELVLRAFGVDLPWTLSRVLILKYIPWFALGVCVYQTVMAKSPSRQVVATVVSALACLAVVDGLGLALLAAALAALAWAAAAGRLPWLGHPVLVFFGAISYPLYLLHENIGWVVLRELQSRGVAFDMSVLAALALSILLASGLTFLIERPAMRAIRGWYASRAAAMKT